MKKKKKMTITTKYVKKKQTNKQTNKGTKIKKSESIHYFATCKKSIQLR